MDFGLPNIRDTLLLMPGFIIGLTFHEYAHGWTAYRLGDDTARNYGRLTLNPIAHLDPIGFLMLCLAGFGWAKPVPVNPYNLKTNFKQGMLMVALAGPVTNVIVALVLMFILSILFRIDNGLLTEIIARGIFINILLAFFNLLPIPPLDGSRILAGLIPGENTWIYNIEQYGFIILLVLVFTGCTRFLIEHIVVPVVQTIFLVAYAFSGVLGIW